MAHTLSLLLYLGTVALLCAPCHVDAQAGPERDEYESFIGWKGEAYQPDLLWKPTLSTGAAGQSQQWVELISWSPRSFVYHNLLTDEECDHLIAASAPMMKKSSVMAADATSVDKNSGFGAFLPRNHDPTVVGVMKKVAEWLGVPSLHHEDIQVLRSGPGQERYTRKDVIDGQRDWPSGKPEGNPRIATVILFLSDVPSGGETIFPNSSWKDPSQQEPQQAWSKCANGHVAAKARKGDALLFFSLWPNGYFDENSHFEDCPVLEGIKWTATMWVHASPWCVHTFNMPKRSIFRDPGKCEDYQEQCSIWKKAGYCETNKDLMVGTMMAGGSRGQCRLTCGACEVCSQGDMECYMRNREQSGYLATPDVWDALEV